MQIEIAIEKINKGIYDDKFLDIYAEEKNIGYQKSRYIDLIKEYEENFIEKDICIFSAPGRCEIIGNHTDHQNGKVLAASVNMDAVSVAAKNNNNIVNIISHRFETISVSLDDLEKKTEEKGTTKALVKGILSGINQRGYKIGGFNACITSDVPTGSGLSSSAAFEVLIGTIISGLYNEMSISELDIAIIGKYAENEYFGKPCGLMDQMACSVGNMVYIDFLDANKPQVEKLDFDLDRLGYSLCITDTKGSHENLTEEYAAIPEEMRKIAKCFNKDTLRGITREMIVKDISSLRKSLGDRAVLRSLHFIEENDRVSAVVKYIKEDEIYAFMREIQASGNSSYKYLQNIYSNIDVENQGLSIALGFSESVLGEGEACRVHGGGFAGTIMAFVKNDKVEVYLEEMEKIFGKGACKTLKIRKCGGVKVI